MAFEGLLSKVGPTLVREATPHLVQLFAGLGERFRKDTRDIKQAFDDEMSSLAQTHAALLSGAEEQRERTETMQNHIVALERRIDILQESVRNLDRQVVETTSYAQEQARAIKNFAVLAFLCALLSFGASAGLLALHLLHR